MSEIERAITYLKGLALRVEADQDTEGVLKVVAAFARLTADNAQHRESAGLAYTEVYKLKTELARLTALPPEWAKLVDEARYLKANFRLEGDLRASRVISELIAAITALCAGIGSVEREIGTKVPKESLDAYFQRGDFGCGKIAGFEEALAILRRQFPASSTQGEGE